MPMEIAVGASGPQSEVQPGVRQRRDVLILNRGTSYKVSLIRVNSAPKHPAPAIRRSPWIPIHEPLLTSRTLRGCDAAGPRAPAQEPRYSHADVDFMQGMIGHHAQALAMAALVPARTGNQSIHLLAQRIEISQRDEIRLMQNWLKDRGQAAPDPGA